MLKKRSKKLLKKLNQIVQRSLNLKPQKAMKSVCQEEILFRATCQIRKRDQKEQFKLILI